MVGTWQVREQALEMGTSRFESRTFHSLSQLPSAKFLNLSKLHFPICKVEIIILCRRNFLLPWLLYSVTVVVPPGTSQCFYED